MIVCKHCDKEASYVVENIAFTAYSYRYADVGDDLSLSLGSAAYEEIVIDAASTADVTSVECPHCGVVGDSVDAIVEHRIGPAAPRGGESRLRGR